jgi:hypothetical protein
MRGNLPSALRRFLSLLFVGELNTLLIEYSRLAVFEVKVEPRHSTDSFSQQNMTAADNQALQSRFPGRESSRTSAARQPWRTDREAAGRHPFDKAWN